MVTFYLLHFSSFGDYSVYQLQGSFEHWRDRKENRTLLSNSKTELWTDFTIERFLSKWFALLLETQYRSASQDNGSTPCYFSGSSRVLTSSFPSSGVWRPSLKKKECCNGEIKANKNIFSKWWGDLVQEVTEFRGSQAAGSLHSCVSLSNGEL